MAPYIRRKYSATDLAYSDELEYQAAEMALEDAQDRKKEELVQTEDGEFECSQGSQGYDYSSSQSTTVSDSNESEYRDSDEEGYYDSDDDESSDGDDDDEPHQYLHSSAVQHKDYTPDSSTEEDEGEDEGV